MRPWLDLFRARLREPADLPTLVHELEQVVRAIIQPRPAVLWAPPDVARHWTRPANLPAYVPDDSLIEHFIAHPVARRANRIEIDSPALAALDAGILVPLVSLG